MDCEWRATSEMLRAALPHVRDPASETITSTSGFSQGTGLSGYHPGGYRRPLRGRSSGNSNGYRDCRGAARLWRWVASIVDVSAQRL